MKKRKGYRSITIRNVLWQYKIGKNYIDAVSEYDERKRDTITNITGYNPDAVFSITPAMISAWLGGNPPKHETELYKPKLNCIESYQDGKEHRCCCGKKKLLNGEPIIINDILHEVLGPRGHFCGPRLHHELRDLRIRFDEAKALLNNAVCFDCPDGPKPRCLWYKERAKLLGWPNDGKRHL